MSLNLNLKSCDLGHFKNTYKVLNLRGLKNSTFYKNHIFECMGKIFCGEFQMCPLHFYTGNICPVTDDIWALVIIYLCWSIFVISKWPDNKDLLSTSCSFILAPDSIMYSDVMLILKHFYSLTTHLFVSKLPLLNSSPPSARYMCQWFRSALVQIIACRPFSTKPLSKPMMDYCQLDP